MFGEIIHGYRWLAQRRIGSFARCRAVLSQRGFEAFDQGLPVEWFAQEAGCSRPQGPVAIAFDGKGRDEDEGKGTASGEQVGLQIQAAHGRHSDIGYHARSVVEVGRSQEIFGRGKCMDHVAKRPDEIPGGGANRTIIVDDRYDWWVGQGGFSWRRPEAVLCRAAA